MAIARFRPPVASLDSIRGYRKPQTILPYRPILPTVQQPSTAPLYQLLKVELVKVFYKKVNPATGDEESGMSVFHRCLIQHRQCKVLSVLTITKRKGAWCFTYTTAHGQKVRWSEQQFRTVAPLKFGQAVYEGIVLGIAPKPKKQKASK